ncbi:MAG TPA: SEC59/DGK1/VTE5 family protein [Ignavibacteria bacterium]|nr:SEC59/DGK1/VTE5 family protein [Ignavibacteria bacterium]HRK00115.1 SEC59/DGK1/VTE5 family protein [Ignavibacteria bacterium]
MRTINKTEFKNELYRKGIHLFSSVIPIAYIFIESREFIIWFLSVLTIVMFTIDYFRYKNPGFKKLYMSFLGNILRPHEVNKKKAMFTGGSYLVLSFLICVVIFPKPVAVMSMLVLVVSDSFAAISGKLFGRTKIGEKSLEGSAGFFISGLAVLFVTPKLTDDNIEYIVAAATLLITTAFELLPLKFDDNVIIPVFFGVTYLILFKLFL